MLEKVIFLFFSKQKSNFLGSTEAISDPQSSEFDQSSIYGCWHVCLVSINTFNVHQKNGIVGLSVMAKLALLVVAVGNCGRSEILVEENEEMRSAAQPIYHFPRVWLSHSCKLMWWGFTECTAKPQTEILNSHGAEEQIINYKVNKLDGRHRRHGQLMTYLSGHNHHRGMFPARRSLSDKWEALLV